MKPAYKGVHRKGNKRNHFMQIAEADWERVFGKKEKKNQGIDLDGKKGKTV